MGTGPIFIGGLSYSGKTQLRLMLNGHPRLAITRRTKMWTRYFERFGDLAYDANFDRCLEAMLRSKAVQELQPDVSRIRRAFRQGPATYPRLFACFHAQAAAAHGKPRWGDQMGGLEEFAEIVFDAFPDAHMIHMMRDPRTRFVATGGSSQGRWGKLGRETALWRQSARLARRNQAHWLDRYRVFRFEDLREHTELTLRAICAFLQEEFHPAMMPGLSPSGPDANLWERSDEIEQQAGEALSPRERAYIEREAAHEMQALGYQPDPIAISVADRVLLETVVRPFNIIGAATWQLWNERTRGIRRQPSSERATPAEVWT